jgi:uncharacterized membrane protein YfcA
MGLEEFILFIGLALIAEILGTVSGFGSSLLFVPVAALFFEFKIVLGITAVFHVFSNVSKIYLFKEGLDKNIAIKLGVPAVVGVLIGALLTNLLSQVIGELIMSIIVVLMSLILLFSPGIKINKTDQNLYAGGAVSGFLAGLIGTGGAIRGLTLIAFNLEKQVFITTSAWIDLGVDFSRSIIYILNGYFKYEHILLIPFLIVISLLGSWLGKLILDYTSQFTFRLIVLLVIALVSLLQLGKLIHQAWVA